MAAGLGFIEFSTGDVLSAAAANGYLASQAVMVFASSAARTSAIASPQEGMISYLKDTNAVEKYDGAAWVSVAGGGGGKVLQVLTTTKTDTFSTTSTTATAITGLDVTITPSAATSKILVLCFMSVSSDTAVGFPVFYLQRGATQILIGDAGAANQRRVTTGVLTNANYLANGAVSYLDSPSSTSALTYGMYVSTADTTGTVRINRTNADGNVNYNARGTSTITVMEIGA